MTDSDLAATIDAAWEGRDVLGPSTRGAYRDAVEEALDALDAGRVRVAEKTAAGWQVHQWLKKAVLLSFRLNDMIEIPGGPVDPKRGAARWWDKVPSKFAGWSANRFRDAGFRAVPGAIHPGRVPAYSVVVPGSLPGRALPDGSPGPGLYCAVIVKQVDAQTRAKTAINELLRE